MSLVDWVTTVYPSQTLGFWSIKQTNQAIADQMENKSNNFPLIHSEEFHEIYLWICFRLHSEWVCYSYSTLSGIGPRKLRCAEGGRDWLFRTDLIPLAWIWKWLTGCFEKEDMVGRIMATPPKMSISNSQKLWIFYLPWQKGFCQCDYGKDLEMWDYPGLVGWVQ